MKNLNRTTLFLILSIFPWIFSEKKKKNKTKRIFSPKGTSANQQTLLNGFDATKSKRPLIIAIARS